MVRADAQEAVSAKLDTNNCHSGAGTSDYLPEVHMVSYARIVILHIGVLVTSRQCTVIGTFTALQLYILRF